MKNFKLITKLLLIASFIFIYSCDSESELNTDSIDNSSMGKGALKSQYDTNMLGKNAELDDPRDCCGGMIKEHIAYENLSFPNITNSFNQMYDIRDNILSKGEGSLGQIYIDAYYELSTMIKNEDINLNEIAKVSSIIPDLINVYNKMKKPNYNGVIIDDNLKNEVLQLLDVYKGKRLGDNRYQNILSAIKLDVQTLTNRDKVQIDNFLAQ